jgi:4-hydroxymandelate oxidase
MTDADLDALLTLADFEAEAQHRLDEQARAYVGGGAGDEQTVAENLAAWRRWLIRARVFPGAVAGTEVELLGRARPHPVIVAPTAFAGLCHPEGEAGIARAAAATGTVMCLATLAGMSPARLAAAVPEVDRWFQLYVLRDRGMTQELIEQARDSGFAALVVTADRPVIGVRNTEARHAVRSSGPGPAPDLDRAIGSDTPADYGAMIDPAVRWEDLSVFAQAGLPIIVKGILTGEDARLARDHGAAAVVVSNHGGRQLDGVPAGADVLAEVVDAVGSELDVIVDGGIRRGTDVLKALALGARAVMIGRPTLWGLASGGSAGTQRVIEILLGELTTALTLAGVTSPAQLDRSFLARATR